MTSPLGALRDATRSRLWPLPVVSVVAALIIGLAVPHLDAAVDGSLPDCLSAVTFGGDAGAARTVLDAVSSSLITVTSLTFSLTVVTLQLASSQFSPRLLRTFTSDMFVQATLGVFLATFTYSLTVLRTVRSSDAAVPQFVPRLSVTLSFLLAIASVIVLIVFLAHLARQIRVETMLHDVHEDASTTVRSTLRRLSSSPDTPQQAPQTPPEAWKVTAPGSGFLVRVDQQELLGICVDLDMVVVLDTHIGSSLVEGSPVGSAWSASGAVADDDLQNRLQQELVTAVHTSIERTAVQDIGYGLRQLTDVANKALSPGINDPTTAVHALGHISALLCELTGYDLGPLLLSDEERTRVVLHRPDLENLVDVAITQPRRYGASDPQVMQRLFQLLAELAQHCRPDQHAVVHARSNASSRRCRPRTSTPTRWPSSMTPPSRCAQPWPETELGLDLSLVRQSPRGALDRSTEHHDGKLHIVGIDRGPDPLLEYGSQVGPGARVAAGIRVERRAGSFSRLAGCLRREGCVRAAVGGGGHEGSNR